jgi:hypothetical protein
MAWLILKSVKWITSPETLFYASGTHFWELSEGCDLQSEGAQCNYRQQLSWQRWFVVFRALTFERKYKEYTGEVDVKLQSVNQKEHK